MARGRRRDVRGVSDCGCECVTARLDDREEGDERRGKTLSEKPFRADNLLVELPPPETVLVPFLSLVHLPTEF